MSAVRFRPRPPFFLPNAAAGILNSDQVSQCIDALCQCGCDAVRATITAMESGLVVPQVETLSKEDRQRVLNELKAVMAVYDDRK